MKEESDRPVLLFVDDDRDIQSAARLLFHRRGITVLAAHDAQEAMSLMAVYAVDLVLLDLNYTRGATTGAEGLALLRDLRSVRPVVPVVVVTGHSGVTIAVEAMRAGATDFVMKPWNNERLVRLVSAVLEDSARADAARHDSAGEEPVMIVGSGGMAQVVAQADRLAMTQAPLVICGPPGCGKMALARRIHALSRQEGEACLISAEACKTLPAGAGCWIVRDIEALSPLMQRALADRLDQRGAPRVIALSALPRSELEARLQSRLMLSLGLVTLEIPGLQERTDDIPVLVTHFLRYFSVRHRLPTPECDDHDLAALQAMDWPQNIRALRAVVERAVLTGSWALPMDGTGIVADGVPTLRDAERAAIEVALKKSGFNVTQAARELGLTRPALYRRMARYGL